MSVFEMTAGIVVSVISGWVIVSIARLFFENKARQSRALSAANDDRLVRIEQALEAIAVEVERIAEGQRFATRLLAEREPGDRVPGSAKLTSHTT